MSREAQAVADAANQGAASLAGPARAVRLGSLVVVLLLGVGADQWTKALARECLANGERVYVGGSVRLLHRENAGAFLSLGEDLSARARFWIFVAANTALLGFVLAYSLTAPFAGRGELACYALILAGGLGNLVDRVGKGTVTDFVQLRAGPVGTGVFNVADLAIVGGVLALVLGGGRRGDDGTAARGAAPANLNREALS